MDDTRSVERYEELQTEYNAVMRTPDEARDANFYQRRERLFGELRVFLSVPPDGFTLPSAAGDLIIYAKAHGWDGYAQWTPPGWDATAPGVAIHIGRYVTDDLGYVGTGRTWHYKFEWSARDCAPGKLRRNGGLCTTPDHPQVHSTPSVKAVKLIIDQYPATVVDEPAA